MNYLMTANDVAKELGVSKGHAYKVIRTLNEELKEKGFVVITGKSPENFGRRNFTDIQIKRHKEGVDEDAGV